MRQPESGQGLALVIGVAAVAGLALLYARRAQAAPAAAADAATGRSTADLAALLSGPSVAQRAPFSWLETSGSADAIFGKPYFDTTGKPDAEKKEPPAPQPAAQAASIAAPDNWGGETAL